jgi:hypothetical protein
MFCYGAQPLFIVHASSGSLINGSADRASRYALRLCRLIGIKLPT